MKTYMLAVLLGLLPTMVQAQEMTARESACYGRIKQEADFIVSRINLIHRDYENRLKHSGLGRFQSGSYSTRKLLDNTIRQYHRRLVHRIQNYPIRYTDRLRHRQHRKPPRCLAGKLQNEAIGTIHQFELSWQKALRQARKNARYFSQLDGMH